MRAVEPLRSAASRVRCLFLAAIGFAILLSFVSVAPAQARDRVRLVVQITVDQLRGDLVLRSRDRWGRGGLRQLYENGAVFLDAHHGHANTETIVGHATLATGADPSVHGMVGNVWFNRSNGSLQYNIEDSRYQIVGTKTLAETHAAPGHAEVSQPVRGRSPEALLAPSIADAIKGAGKGKAKVFAVSLKDRSAVPMAGRNGKALWWSDATGEFVSSSYYYPNGLLPAWAKQWNERRLADAWDGRSWTLLHDLSTYRHAGRDDQPWEVPPAGMLRTFPHRFDRSRLGDKFYAAIAASPVGDSLLVDFVGALLKAEDLGDDDVVDYLSVAMSSIDFIGHRYGPDSLETEDAVLRLDRQIATLLDEIEDAADDDHMLVVLSADHGVVEPPAQLAAKGKPSGRIVLSEVEKSPGMKKVAKKYGGLYIKRQWPPYVYLDRDTITAKNLDVDAIASAIAKEIAVAPGVEAAFTSGDITAGRLPNTPAARAVLRGFHPERSGDIHVVSKPGWQIAFEVPAASQYATGHGTPWDYDTFVPLVFDGVGVRRCEVQRRVDATDVAPTIAALLGIAAPAKASGKVLVEALGDQPRKP